MRGKFKFMTQNNTRYAAYTGLFTTLIILGAFIKIPVPVIPFTLQFLFVSLSGLLLGPKYGGLSVLLYAALGLIGLPVFTAGGGITYVLFPTFGYIIGFILASFFTGLISSKMQENTKNYMFASFCGLIILHITGIPYYYIISHYVIQNTLTFKEIFLFCFVYTVPGDLLLCFISARIALKLKPFINRGNSDDK